MSADDRLIAARYVEALFSLATEAGQHDQVKSDLLRLRAAIGNDANLRGLLTNPIISRDDAETVMAAVLKDLKTSDLTQKFFALLARNHRLAVATLAIDAYLERLAVSRGELKVEVTSASALSDEEIKTLTQAIAKATGKQVAMETQEDPALLGGLKVRVGTKLLDNSVAGKLARLQQSLHRAA